MIKQILLKTINKLGYSIVKNSSIKKTILSKELSYYTTKTGNYYLPTHAYNDVIKKAIINDEVFDKPIVEIATKYIRKGSTVLDVGSNFGQMAILFSNITGEQGIVHAFDADDFIFSILEKNISANKKENIIPHFGAVHDKLNETLYFPTQDFERFETYGSYGLDYSNQKNGRPVNTLTIDSLDIKGDISFIKIDVQGGDLFALKGAIETIKKHQMPIIFEYEYLFEEELNLNFQEYVDFVNEINYKFERVINGQNYLILPK